MPVTSYSNFAMIEMDTLRYLTGEEMDQKLAAISDNDRSLVRYSRWSKEYIFPECTKCGAPKVIHRDMNFDQCDGHPSREFIETMLEMLKHSKYIDKFGLADMDDDIGKLGTTGSRNKKRVLSDESLDLPKGKKVDVKTSPKKSQICNESDNLPCDVIEVFTVDVSEHLEMVKTTSTEKIQKLQAIIDSLDPNDNANKF